MCLHSTIAQTYLRTQQDAEQEQMATKIAGAATVMTAFTRADLHEKIASKVQKQANVEAMRQVYKGNVEGGGDDNAGSLQQLSKGFAKAGKDFNEKNTAPKDDGNTNSARGAAPPTKYRVHDLLPGCTY